MDILEEIEITLYQLNAISLKLTDSILNWDLNTTGIKIIIDSVYPLSTFKVLVPIVFGKIWTPPGFVWVVEDNQNKMNVAIYANKVIYFDNYNTVVNRGIIGEYKKDYYVWDDTYRITTNDKRNMIHSINKIQKCIIARTNRLICRDDVKEAKYNSNHYIRLGNINHPSTSRPPITMYGIPKEECNSRLVLVERTIQHVRDIYFAPTIEHIIDNFSVIVEQLYMPFTIC